jgi:hypothetical protein
LGLGTYALLKDLHLFVLFLIETYKTLFKEATFLFMETLEDQHQQGKQSSSNLE